MTVVDAAASPRHGAEAGPPAKSTKRLADLHVVAVWAGAEDEQRGVDYVPVLDWAGIAPSLGLQPTLLQTVLHRFGTLVSRQLPPDVLLTSVHALAALTSSEDVARFAQAHSDLSAALVALLRRLQKDDDPDSDVVDGIATAMGNVAGSATMNNGHSFVVEVWPLVAGVDIDDGCPSMPASVPAAAPHASWTPERALAEGGTLFGSEEGSAMGGDDDPVGIYLRAVSYVAGGLGSRLWHSSPVLASRLVSPEGRQLLQNAVVLELGAGLGLCGLAAARSGAARVILTDFQADLLENLAEVAHTLNHLQHVDVLQLDWSWFAADEKPTQKQVCTELGNGSVEGQHAVQLTACSGPEANVPAQIMTMAASVDVLLGSDLVYDRVALSVPSVVRYLLKPGGRFLSLHPCEHVALCPDFLEACRSAFVGGSLTIQQVDRRYQPVQAGDVGQVGFFWRIDWRAPDAEPLGNAPMCRAA